jgi:hypothetical protein
MRVHVSSMGPAAVLAALSLFSVAAEAAAMKCGKHDDIAKVLTSKYQETRHILGVVNSRMVMEIFTSPMGTWTVLVTGTDGTSCVTASGEEWQEVPVAIAGLDG